MKIKALIFDFDGLILDTEEPDFLSWQETYQFYGGELKLATWLPFIGAGTTSIPFDIYDHLEKQIGRELDRAEVRRRRRRRYAELLAARPILPGIEKWIADAERLGIRLAVASSAEREWVVGHLTERGLLEHFEFVTCEDEVKFTKPDPDLYLLTLKKLGIGAEEAMALEDSLKGVRAARVAGIFCVAVPNPLMREFLFEEADLRLRTLAEGELEDVIAGSTF
ncbi:MAG TPA: HAD-IA family hydrolase [Ktedonosporobacter sp.]|nr:HAD-IA family hydrolase [Ktedonosporobacter sp.]